MLAGRRFILKIPTLAVDSKRVAVMMPIGAVLNVLSESVDGKMAQVVWDGRPVAMFAIDLAERGREVVEPNGLPDPQAPLDAEQIRKVLQNELEAAQQRRVAASEQFTQIMAEVPSGLPHPDGTHRIRLASREYSGALAEAATAMARLNEFLIRGTIPPDLGGKPPGIETLEPRDKKSSEGR
jgi:hypothetical protein